VCVCVCTCVRVASSPIPKPTRLTIDSPSLLPFVNHETMGPRFALLCIESTD
jgi:hypothetical protein